MTETVAKSRALKILARSLSRQLRDDGYSEHQIVELANCLIGEVTSQLNRTQPQNLQ